MNFLEIIYQSILEGNMNETGGHVQAALDAGLPPHEILHTGMIAAMREVGRLYEEGDYFVPEMLISAHAMQAGLAVLKPRLTDAGIEPVGRVVIATVKGDLHDIGKNLVAMMLEGAGFEVLDLGTDVAPETFVEAVRANKPAIVAMSVLLTTTMQMMKVTIDALKAADVLNGAKVIVGGAPVTREFAMSIGADGFAEDASQAATLAKSLAG